MFELKEIKVVDIMVLSDNALEAAAIRAMLEAFGIQVRMHYIGNAKYFVSLLQSFKYLHKVVIICGHGDNEGLHMPILAPEIEETMPYNEKVTANDFREFLKLDKQIIINTACCLGNKNFADSFLAKGAAAYIGLAGYTEASTCVLFVVNFLYFYLVENHPINKAYNNSSLFKEENFELYV